MFSQVTVGELQMLAHSDNKIILNHTIHKNKYNIYLNLFVLTSVVWSEQHWNW